MSNYKVGLNRVPVHMREAISNWIETASVHPGMMGSFLYALLTNDLMGVYANGDESNIDGMREWVMFLYNNAPSECYGSREKIICWHERGGLQGR